MISLDLHALNRSQPIWREERTEEDIVLVTLKEGNVLLNDALNTFYSYAVPKIW